MNTQASQEAIQKAIEIAGGVTALAKKMSISYHTILTWKSGRTGISIQSCLKLEQAVEGKVKKEEIMPNYPWDKFNNEDKKELEIAKNLLKMGMTNEDISKATGLSVEELKNIKN